VKVAEAPKEEDPGKIGGKENNGNQNREPGAEDGDGFSDHSG
jgi:hypothetical protein